MSSDPLNGLSPAERIEFVEHLDRLKQLDQASSEAQHMYFSDAGGIFDE